jgi:hypothetical protein
MVPNPHVTVARGRRDQRDPSGEFPVHHGSERRFGCDEVCRTNHDAIGLQSLYQSVEGSGGGVCGEV